MYTALVNAVNVDACVVTHAHAKINCNKCSIRMTCDIPKKVANEDEKQKGCPPATRARVIQVFLENVQYNRGIYKSHTHTS